MQNKKTILGLATGLMVGGMAVSADGVTVGGFVDAQYNWSKFDSDSTEENVNTFTVPDGALYLNGKSGMTEVLVDMPFAASDSNADFSHFETKGQAWVGAKYDNGLNWKIGQFDTFVGMEGNDSVDNHFNKGGLIYDNLPTVHRGLGLGYDFSDMLGLTLVVANANYTNDGAMTDGNPDMGVGINAKLEGFEFSVGGIFGKDVANDENRILVDVLASTELAGIDLGLEFGMQKDDATEFRADAYRYLVGLDLGYEVDEALRLGTAVEWSKLKDSKELEWRVGPQYKLSDAMTAKLDYTLERIDTGATLTNHHIKVGAVTRF